MKKTIYVKYTNERSSDYQTETAVFMENGIKKAQKTPLTPDANQHIANMAEMYEKSLLLTEDKKINLVKSDYIKDQNKIIFEYAQGSSFNKLLIDALHRDKNEFLNLLQDYKNIIYSFNNVQFDNFESDDNFYEIFGINLKLNNVKCIKPANIDMNPMNMFVKDNEITLIDYEWYFDFYIPVNYILFRGLASFYYRYKDFVSDTYSIKELLNFYEIPAQERLIYNKMERNFQKKIFNKNIPVWKNVYCKISDLLDF